MQVLLATASGALRKDLPRTCVIKVVNLGDDCKIRSDYKPVLRAEGLALQRFSFPGFVHCYAVWGSAPKSPCAPPLPGHRFVDHALRKELTHNFIHS